MNGLVRFRYTWAKKVKHPKEVLKRDQEVTHRYQLISGQRCRFRSRINAERVGNFRSNASPGDTGRGKFRVSPDRVFSSLTKV